MKRKLLSLLLAVCIALLPLCACQSIVQETGSGNAGQPSESTEKNKPVILVDSIELTKARNRVLQYAYYLYGTYNIDFKLLTQNSSEREMELSNMRVEIMAGGGPDAFVLPCDDLGSLVPFFQNVEKTMRSGIFLPMDDLIEQSEYLNMEDHHEVIMDAGKTEEGQIVLPLLYSCSAYFIEKDSLQGSDIQWNTWENIISCKDERVLNFLRSKSFEWFGHQYTKFADYEEENLLITPEDVERDLSSFTKLSGSANGKLTTPEFPYVFDDYALEEWAKDPKSLDILTMPNDDGGLTATITAYAAINRNTEYAEEVFKFIELLFSEEVQNNEGHYLPGIDGGAVGQKYYGNASRPSAYLLGTGKGVATHKKAYPDAQGKLLAELTAKINSVRFWSDMDTLMCDEASDAMFMSNKDEAYFQNLAEDICTELEMMLAE